MKKVTLAIAMAALLLFAGCKKDKETTGTTLKASIEQQQGGGSKTSLDPSNGAIKWTAGDKILVNNGTTNGIFTLDVTVTFMVSLVPSPLTENMSLVRATWRCIPTQQSSAATR